MPFSDPTYTQTPNEILGEVVKGGDMRPGMMAFLKEGELKVLLAVVRLTLGYRQRYFRASLSDMENLTQLSRPTVSKSAKVLEDLGLIARKHDGGVTRWALVFEEDEGRLVKNFNHPLVKNFNQASKKFLPPSKKEKEKETQSMHVTHARHAHEDETASQALNGAEKSDLTGQPRRIDTDTPYRVAIELYRLKIGQLSHAGQADFDEMFDQIKPPSNETKQQWLEYAIELALKQRPVGGLAFIKAIILGGKRQGIQQAGSLAKHIQNRTPAAKPKSKPKNPKDRLPTYQADKLAAFQKSQQGDK